MKSWCVFLIGMLFLSTTSLTAFSRSSLPEPKMDMSEQPEASSIKPLQGGVEIHKIWTLDTAKKEALKGASLKLDTEKFAAFDPNYDVYLKARISKQSIINNHLITVFSNGFYSATEKCSKQMFFYSPKGKLIAIEQMTSTSFATPQCMPHYPNKAYQYSYPEGKLFAISIKVALHELFVFKANGELLTHWKNNDCFKNDGSSCGHRKTFITR